jgi:hypothetical protein
MVITKPKKSEANEKQHYVNNKTFTNILVTYYNAPDSPEGQVAYEQIGKIFLLLVNKIASSSNWRGYDQFIKDEMKQDALFMMITKLSKYDHEKYDNPFSYFSSVVINVFRQHMNKLKRSMQRNVRFEGLQENGMEYLIVDSKFGNMITRGQVNTKTKK